MFRKKVWIVVALVLALNACVLLLRYRQHANQEAIRLEARVSEAKELGQGLRAIPALSSNEPLFLIGHLVQNKSWSERLALAPEQQEAIRRLDQLVMEARNHSCAWDADFLDTAPADYQEFHQRSVRRRAETVRHAQRMVMLGLLTPAQAEVAMQRYLTTIQPIHTLDNRDVQAALGMSEEQYAQLQEVWRKVNERQGDLNLMTIDRKEKRENAAVMAANNRAGDEAALKILTPSQRKKWSEMTSQRNALSSPPELPTVLDADAAQQELTQSSPLFRDLAENGRIVQLSGEQQKLLEELVSLTELGLLWISKNRESHAETTRAEFLKQAELFALDGILTEPQSERVKKLIDKDRAVRSESAGNRRPKSGVSGLTTSARVAGL